MSTRRMGPPDGTLRVHTYREGVAQRIGHDLVLEVGEWDATVELEPGGGALHAARLSADSTSLQVRDARNGVKPLTDKDRLDIHDSIEQKVLLGKPISFASSAVEARDGGATVTGDLTIAGTTRAISFDVHFQADGRTTATVTLVQSEWEIKPYRALMGALKVRDAVEVALDVRMPADG